MKKQKLTPWFPPEIKPVHDGLYETFGGFSFWWSGGSAWMAEARTKKGAMRHASRMLFGFQGKTWRGLAEKPKVAVPNTVKAKKGK